MNNKAEAIAFLEHDVRLQKGPNTILLSLISILKAKLGDFVSGPISANYSQSLMPFWKGIKHTESKSAFHRPENRGQVISKCLYLARTNTQTKN